MKNKIIICAFLAAALAIVGFSAAQETKPESQACRRENFMSQKLLYAQLAFEGLMTDHNELVIEYGTKMLNTTRTNTWPCANSTPGHKLPTSFLKLLRSPKLFLQAATTAVHVYNGGSVHRM